MIKSLKRNDIRSTPFVANKSWNSQNQTFDNTISWQSGSQSGSLFLSFVDYKDGTQLSLHSSSIAYQQQDPDFLRFRIGQEITGNTFYPTSSKYYDSSVNPTNIDGTYQGLVYNTLKNLFYKETANPTQIFGLESLNPVDVNRTLTKQINVFNVPQNKFGEKIVPNSIEIKQQLDDGHFVVIDDGNTNLKLSGSHFVDVQNAMYNCVSAIINVTDTSYTYDGSPKSASVATIPSDLITITTYNGSETPPTNAGTYTILSTIWDGYYCGSTGSTFIINKAVDPPPEENPPTITVTTTSSIYDGNPHYTTATTTPSGLSYTIVYTLNGKSILDNTPIDVGVYTATATVDDGNYTVTGIGTVTINPPILTVNFNAITDQEYGTTTIALSASSSPFSYPIKYSITSGDTLAQILDSSKPEILLSPSLTATSLGSVTVKAETIVPQGYTSAYATRTFTVTPKPITLDVNQITVTYPGSGTDVSIDNTKLNNWLVSQNPSQLVTRTDTVTISGPSTGTIPSANPGTPDVTLGSYTLGGTHAAKYSLRQPTLTAVVPAVSKITLTDITCSYDGNAYTIKDIIDNKCIGNAALEDPYQYTIQFFDKTNLLMDPKIGNPIYTEKYWSKLILESSGNPPINVGNYKINIINQGQPGDTKTKGLLINPSKAIIELDNLKQGGVKTTGYDPVYTFSSASFKVNWSGQESKIRNTGPNYSSLIPTTFAENITDPILKSVNIKDRNFKDIDLLAVDKTLYTPTITYVGGNPTVIGESFVQASFSPSVKNVYGDTQAKLEISDFYYITTASLQVQEYGYNGYTTQSLSVAKYYDRTSLSSEIRDVIKKSRHNFKLEYTLVGGGGGGSGETNTKFIPSVKTDTFPYNLDVAYGGGGAAYIHLSWSFAPLTNGTAFADTDTNSPVYYNESIRLVAGKKGDSGSVALRMNQGYKSQSEVYVEPATNGSDSYIDIHYTGAQVVAWGYNPYGQTTVPEGLTDVTAIVAGESHTVALKSDGTVVAWGYNGYGQTTVPDGLSGVTAIARGLEHTVALKSDGTVVAWGYNVYGQTAVPAGLTRVRAIAAGAGHTVALKSDGSVVAWGRNNYGQTTVPAGLTGVTVTAIAGGGVHTVALKSDGTVVAWGRNDQGQTSVPTGLTGVTAIAAGWQHTVALKRDGTVVAWGWNEFGITTVPDGVTGVTAIAAGQAHTVALKGNKWLGITSGGASGAMGYSIYRINTNNTNNNWKPGFTGLGGKAYFDNSEKTLSDKILSPRLQYYAFNPGSNGTQINNANFIPQGGGGKYGGGAALGITQSFNTSLYQVAGETKGNYISYGVPGEVGYVIIQINGIHRIYKNTFSNVIYDSHPESEYQ